MRFALALKVKKTVPRHELRLWERGIGRHGGPSEKGSRVNSGDPAAAYHHVTIVEHGSLAGGDSALRLIEGNQHFPGD